MIGYFNTGDHDKDNEYGHSEMYIGDQQITAHSVSRFKKLGHWGSTNTWHLHKRDQARFTLIHFTDGDTAPSADTSKLLEGWWEVKMGGGPARFYLFKAMAPSYEQPPSQGASPTRSPTRRIPPTGSKGLGGHLLLAQDGN